MQGSIQKVTRRKAAAWLIGGTVVAGIAAVGSGFYLTISAIGQQSKARPPQSHKRYTLHGHEQAVSSLAWSPDGSRLASGSLDRSVRVWNLDQPEMPLIIKSQKSGIQALAWEPSGTRIAAGARDNSIQIYIAADGSLDKAFISRNAAISRLAWSRDADTLFVSTLRNGLEKITLSTGAIEQAGTRASFRTLAVSPNGRYVAVGMDNGFLLIFSLPELSRLYTGHQHKGSIRALAWSPDSIYLASGGTDESLQVLNVTTKQVTNRVTLNALINDIAWQPRATPGTERVAAGLADGSIRIWSPGNNNLALYKEHTTAVNAVSWGRQGLASGSNDKTIIVWNV